MKYLFLDQDLYLISEADMEKYDSEICSCCGSCNKYTLQDLREVCLSIKAKYKPLKCEFNETPEDQKIKKEKIDMNDDLPF